ncbi:MAG TPA: MBL fold metallo-hydrolase [Spirochaetia bacterium]|nr:MBL fold metallo-hydrolase [Spirochaetia bacterium]
MKITWLGHACFLVEDSQGTRVIVDPFDVDPKAFAERGLKFAYPPIAGVKADLVLISHDHLDHNGAGVVEGSPLVIRESGDYHVAGIPVRAVAGEHDPEGGKVRGANLLLRWEMDGLSLAHFGDFGQKALRPEQIEALGNVDILFLPVGGDPQKGPTVDAQRARRIVDLLNPHLVIPMHYATPAVNFLQPVEPFLRLMSQVEEKESATVEVSPGEVLSMTATVFVLQPPGGAREEN